MKTRMLFAVALTFALASAWAVSVFGPDEIIMLPEKTRNITMTVENSQLRELPLAVHCKSDLKVACQKQLVAPKNGSEEFWVEVKAGGAGYFPVVINVGGVEKTLGVRVSESPLSLKTLLENYNRTLNNIEGRTGRTKAIAIARGVWANAVMLYDEEKYEDVSEELGTLRRYVEVAMREPPLGLNSGDEEGGQASAVPLKAGLIPLSFLVLLSGLFVIKRKAALDETKKFRMSSTRDLMRMRQEAVVAKGGDQNGQGE